MNSSARFWTLMVVFQVAFGLAVFAATRHYYLSAPNQAAAGTALPSQAAWPNTTPSQGTPTWPGPGAESDLENLISSFPVAGMGKDPQVLVAHADDLFGKAQYDEAARLYQQALEADPKDVNTYNNLGITLHYLGRSGEALEVLNEGIALDPSYQRIWLTLGYVSSQVGQAEQARAALAKAVQMDPNSDIGQSASSMLESLF